MRRIVITEFMDESAVERLRAECDVLYDRSLADDHTRLQSLLGDVDALIVRNRTSVDAALLRAAPRLRVVGRLGVGLDNIDVETCRLRGVEVIPAIGANAQAVAEYVIASALVLLRPTFLSSAEVAAGGWPRERLSQGRELSEKMLGLVGCGSIGQATARLARAFRMHVCGYDPLIPAHASMWSDVGIERVDLSVLLERADIVSLHLPLTNDTRGMLGASLIGRMKKGAVLVNTSRGGVVDEQALARALNSGHLAGAALDVFEQEPLPAGSPLAGTPRLLLTPHVAGVTMESNQRVSTLIAERVLASLLKLPAR